MSNKFEMTTGQAHELAMAFGRNGWTNEEVKILSSGDLLNRVREIVIGQAEIKPIDHIINCDAPVFIPDGWSVLPDEEQLPNRVRGQFAFDSSNVKLHLDESQKNGKYVVGDKLRKKLKDEPVYTAHVLEYLLAHPHLIPEEWKCTYIFFWGTIYRGGGGGLYVRYLGWGGGEWGWSYGWLNDGVFDGDFPTAVRAH